MHKEFQGRLDALTCSVAHAARKDAKRKAQLGELKLKLAAHSRGGPAGDGTHDVPLFCRAGILSAPCTHLKACAD